MSTLPDIGRIVAAHARLRPHKIGTRDSRRTLTFAQWNARACRLANGLRGRGLEPGDRVALLAYNRVEWMEMYVALAKAGLVAVPLNFRLVGPEIRYIAEHCRARAFIVQDALADRVDALRGELDVAADAWIHLGDATPAGWTGYEALIAASADAEPAVDVRPTDPWALMYTSGTTGKPKGAIRNHHGNALMSLVTALDMSMTVDDTALLVMPMCHANSLNFLCTFTYLGATAQSTTARASIPKRCWRRWRRST